MLLDVFLTTKCIFQELKEWLDFILASYKRGCALCELIVSCTSVLLETVHKLKASLKPHLRVAACQLAQGVCMCVYQCVYGKWHKHGGSDATAGLRLNRGGKSPQPHQSSQQGPLASLGSRLMDQIPSKLNANRTSWSNRTFSVSLLSHRFNMSVPILMQC